MFSPVVLLLCFPVEYFLHSTYILYFTMISALVFVLRLADHLHRIRHSILRVVSYVACMLFVRHADELVNNLVVYTEGQNTYRYDSLFLSLATAKDKGEKKLFGFAFTPLMRDDGTTLSDDIHELYVYKVTILLCRLFTYSSLLWFK